jgi:hypothetical protein
MIDESFSWYYNEPAVEQMPYWMPVQEQFPSSIVALRCKNDLTLTEVYNLFSNFGNVEKIVKKTAQTYVMYTNFEFAVAAK